MRRQVLVLCLAVFTWVGCGDKQASQEQPATAGDAPGAIANQLPPADVTSQPGDAMIQESGQEFPVDGLFLNPYFDDAGTVTELAVAPGATFVVHVFAETVEPYATNATQYRITLPTGVEVTAVNEFEHKSVSTGDPKVSYMLAYDCQPAGRFRLVSYTCRVTGEFQGGEVELGEGLPATGVNFIGFVSCEFVEMRATGGSATLTRK